MGPPRCDAFLVASGSLSTAPTQRNRCSGSPPVKTDKTGANKDRLGSGAERLSQPSTEVAALNAVTMAAPPRFQADRGAWLFDRFWCGSTPLDQLLTTVPNIGIRRWVSRWVSSAPARWTSRAGLRQSRAAKLRACCTVHIPPQDAPLSGRYCWSWPWPAAAPRRNRPPVPRGLALTPPPPRPSPALLPPQVPVRPNLPHLLPPPSWTSRGR